MHKLSELDQLTEDSASSRIRYGNFRNPFGLVFRMLKSE